MPAIPGGIGTQPLGGSPTKPRPTKAPKTKRVKAAREPFFANLGEKKPLIIGVCVFVGLLALALGVGLLYGGDQSKEYHATLMAIYDDHKALRDRKAKDTEWNALTERVDELQDTMVAYLDKKASGKRRAQQELLFAARDYLPLLLKDSHKKPSSNERDFKNHMDTAGKLLGIEK